MKLWLITGFSVVGGILGIIQTKDFLALRSGIVETNRLCNVNATFDCTAIEMSRFAELIPGLPLSSVAMAGFFLMAILSLIARMESQYEFCRKWLKILSVFSVAMSLFYLGIMFYLGKGCLYCLLTDVMTFSTFAAVFQLKRQPHHQRTPFFSSTLVYCGLAAVVLAVFFTAAVGPKDRMTSEDRSDIRSSLLAGPILDISIPEGSNESGDRNAPITLVKFSDFECPSCKNGSFVIEALRLRFPKALRIVSLNFPLSSECNSMMKRVMHPAACLAAKVALCSGKKHAEVEHALFSHQSELRPDNIYSLAAATGANAEELQACAEQTETRLRLNREVELGNTLKIQATPTYFLNGRKIEGGLPTHLWIDLIETLLKTKS
jgi:uncharacterized membrane protein/predicted DsbA family dithiol-disulfide isomerase